MRDRTAPTRFAVVVYDDVEPIDIGGTIGVLSMARRVLPGLEALTVAERRGPVRLAGGLTILTDVDFASLPPCDQLIVCGGPGWRHETANAAMIEFLHRQAPTRLASVCTGGLILAAAGVLDGRLATTRRHPVGGEAEAPLDLLKRLAPAARPKPAAVVDAGVVTGGGVSLAIDVTLYLIGRLYGDWACNEVASVIEYDRAFAVNRTELGHLRQADDATRCN
ncbi:MAG TPA: DJ-1/PfpI family protein [Xanthobacteraceae bacterium]|nr:DJ-1/PfpI family protein [Xanthobacteraceae bacterium]